MFNSCSVENNLKSNIKIISIPMIIMAILASAIYLFLNRFSTDLSLASTQQKSYQTTLANNQLSRLLLSNSQQINHFVNSPDMINLVLKNQVSVIADSLSLWRSAFNVPILTFFDVESNTLYLPDAPSKPGEYYGLSNWVTEQLSGPNASREPQLLMFRGKPTWMRSAPIQIAGEIRGLVIYGVVMDQSFVDYLYKKILHPIILTHENGGQFIGGTINKNKFYEKINLTLPQSLHSQGFKIAEHFLPYSPYRHVIKWPTYGLILVITASLFLLGWLLFRNLKQQKQWRFIGSLADSPDTLKALNLQGTEKSVADNIIHQIETLTFKNESLTNLLAKSEHTNQHFKKNIQQIKGEKNKLQHAPKVKSGFLSRMGDEITSPMKSVSSMLKLLLESKLADEPAEIVEIAARSHQMMSSNIDNVLDFSKLDSGLLKLFMADFDIEVLIKELIKELEPHAQSKELKVEWNINDRVPESCHGDRQRIHQILYNLAGNAIRFTKEGSVGIYVDMIYEKGRQFIRYTVKDTGIGIPKSAQDAVFESLDPHSKLTTSSFAGRLRLIVCKQLTELMGGEMGLSSEVGKGSRFWFTIRYQNPRG